MVRTDGRSGVGAERAARQPGEEGRHSERGAALVEFALILPLLLVLTFGIIEYSQLFSAASTVSNATRSGARTASAEPRQPAFASDAAAAVGTALSALPGSTPQELWVYRATQGTGLPDSGGFSSYCSHCVVYRWDASTRKFNTASPVVNGWPATDQNACGGTADEIGVYVKVVHAFVTKLFGTSKTLSSRTVMRLEPIPSSQQCGP